MDNQQTVFPQQPMQPMQPMNNRNNGGNGNTPLIIVLIVIAIVIMGLLVALLFKNSSDKSSSDSDKDEEKTETIVAKENTKVVVVDNNANMKSQPTTTQDNTGYAILNAYRGVLNRNKGGKYFLINAPGCKYPTIWATSERVHINDNWNYSDEPQIVLSGYKVTPAGYTLLGHLNIPTWADVMCSNGKVGYWGGSSGMVWNISSSGVGYSTSSSYIGSPNWYRTSNQSAIRQVVGL